MRALVKPGPAPGFVLSEVPVPSIGPTDVLIRVEKAGLCGTDYHIYTWDSWAQHRVKPPLIVGHEFMEPSPRLAMPYAPFASANAFLPRGTSWI